MADWERQILIAGTARKIEDMIREGARDLGDILKSMGVDVKESQLKALDIYAQAVEVLKTKAQQAQSRLEKE